MGMRDWLIIIVIVGIVLILLDGYRRKRKDSIRVKLEKNIPDHDVELDTAAELPNGGARVISRYESSGMIEDDYADDYDEYDEEDEDEDIEEEEVVPVLMDAVDLENVAAASNKPKNDNLDSEDFAEPSYEDDDIDEIDDIDNDEDRDDLDEAYEEYEEHEEHEEYAPVNEDYLEADKTEKPKAPYADEQVHAELAELDDDDVSVVRTSPRNAGTRATENIGKTKASDSKRIEPTLGELGSLTEAELEDKPAHLKSKQKKHKADAVESGSQAELFAESPEDFIQDEEHDESEGEYLEPEEVIVINVMAKQGELFAGSDLLPILLQQNMRLGKMSIFHKHADSSGNGPAIFSMANMVKPGTFDVTQMEEFTTPGVSFFLQLPNAFGNMKSFEQMLKAADAIKDKLNGDLKDEHRSVITRQTIEHCRQRIQDFELAQLSKK